MAKKLSEAIRVGGMGVLQIRDGALAHYDEQWGWGVCALGAALRYLHPKMEDWTSSDQEENIDDIGEHLEMDLFKKHACHPLTGLSYSLYTIITNLNDIQGWTFAEIANWLEGLEL